MVYIRKIPTYNIKSKYEFSLPYVPIFGLIEIFDFTACVCPDLVRFHVEPVCCCTLALNIRSYTGYIKLRM